MYFSQCELCFLVSMRAGLIAQLRIKSEISTKHSELKSSWCPHIEQLLQIVLWGVFLIRKMHWFLKYTVIVSRGNQQ